MSCLATELNAANTVIAAYTYDNNGSVKTQTQKFDGVTTNDAITSFDDDPLNRLTKITAALAGITQYGHNGVDHLVFVNDPRTLVTSYAVDGLDNQKQLISPDTGTTNNIYTPPAISRPAPRPEPRSAPIATMPRTDLPT